MQFIDNPGCDFAEHCVIDLVSATNIVSVGMFDDFSDGYRFSIDNVAFNPSLAPTAVTPEPSGAVLLGTGALLLCAYRVRRRFSAS